MAGLPEGRGVVCRTHRDAIAERQAAMVVCVCATSPSPAAQPSTTMSTRLAPTSPTVASLSTESGPDTVPFHLDVSNQSLEILEVRLVVELDDRVMIDDVFAVEDQHNYVRHDLHLDGDRTRSWSPRPTTM